jgi:hypothetical protein
MTKITKPGLSRRHLFGTPLALAAGAVAAPSLLALAGDAHATGHNCDGHPKLDPRYYPLRHFRLAIGVWWTRYRESTSSRALGLLRLADAGTRACVERPGKFALCVLLLSLGPNISGALSAESADSQPREICGGDYVCVADGSTALAAWPASRPEQSAADGGRVERCPRASAGVAAESPDERNLACSAVSDALQLLGRCGISPRRPLKLQIMNEVRNPIGAVIFGQFDPKRERILITHESNIPSLIQDTPYASLPLRDFYRSIIVHEVVHGIMHQNMKRPAETHTAHEYPAYALQIESLDPKVRDEFLRLFDQTAIKANTLFSDAILFFDPYFFAARAYHHFKASANSCAYLFGLLEGGVGFIAPSRM